MEARKTYVPTLEEIAEAAKKIRDGWSPEKWASQSNRVEWSVPTPKNPSITERISTTQ